MRARLESALLRLRESVASRRLFSTAEGINTMVGLERSPMGAREGG